ncbi:E3 ubiquitin-protein ligase rnf14 [Chytridiales sp. JEL 0842]|nr:E3 ubiquitin-protein ligase rnf14 [Chytridiales sp. JEL 0842]
MPANYPSESSLKFAIDCPWLTDKRKQLIRKHLGDIWERDRGVVLFSFSDFLQNEAVDVMELISKETDAKGIPLVNLDFAEAELLGDPNVLSNYLEMTERILEYDKERSQYLFDTSMVRCGICFETMKGALCRRFIQCSHAYCLGCLKDYYTLLITEGDISQVTCPDEVCKKLKPPPLLEDYQLKSIVSAEMFERYQDLAEKSALEGRSDVTYCPRPFCRRPVILDPNEEKLAICSYCGYVFCFICGTTWHGYAQYCKTSHLMSIAKEYMVAPEHERLALERRYGKKAIEKMVREVEDTKAMEAWIQENATSCPTCSMPVERVDGCAHMTCRVCKTHFCYVRILHRMLFVDNLLT